MQAERVLLCGRNHPKVAGEATQAFDLRQHDRPRRGIGCQDSILHAFDVGLQGGQGRARLAGQVGQQA